MYPKLPMGPIFSLASTYSGISYQATLPMVLPPRKISDRNQGTIRVHVFFSMSDLSLAEDKLGRFSEHPELFTKEFTQLMRSFGLTLADLQILSHCCPPEKKQHVILAVRVHADQVAAQAQEGHEVHRVGNNAVPKADPQWNHQINFINRDRWDHMISCFIKDMKKLTVKPINYKNVKNVQQGPDENPAVFKEISESL